MVTQTKPTIKNNLRQIRQRCGFEQKQVAFVLNKKNTEQISRYEGGNHLPRLRTALLLEAIYQIPIRLMYPDLFEQCCREVSEARNQNPQLFSHQDWLPNQISRLAGEEYCFYANLLKNRLPNLTEIRMADKHATNVVYTTCDLRSGGLPSLL